MISGLAYVAPPEAVHKRLDTGAVDKDGKRYHDERQLDKIQRQFFG